ncbi:MAG TPA: hypothetical protein ENN29_03925 [Candidatus Hydrogenedentes bacterium]|nr:hypothetical protein [Candidatus Hydrogenedentota bacterium]
MNIRSLTYSPSGEGAPQTCALEPKLNALHCADAHTSRNVSRLLCRMLAVLRTAGVAPPVAVSGNMPGMRALSAVFAPAETPLPGDVPSISDDDIETDPLGTDLFLLALEDALDADRTPENIATAMAAIVDTGGAGLDLISAIARLDSFAVRIGRGDGADSPLARERARLEALRTERAAAMGAMEKAALQAEELRRRRDETARCKIERAQAEQRLCAAVLYHGGQCMEQLERLEKQIKEVSERPRVDSEQAAAIQRGETLVETARLQLERTRGELHEVLAALDEAQATQSPDAAAPGDPELLERLQREMQTGQGRITEFNARLDEVNNQIAALDEHVTEAQERLATLPDFSRIAPNPIDWLTQLARSFKTAIGVRDNEEEARDSMRDELADLRVEIAGDASIFENSVNFAEELAAHQNKKKQWETRSVQITDRIRRDRSLRDELLDRMPGLFLLSLGCGLFLCLLLGLYVGLQKTPLLLPGGLVTLSALFFLAQLVITRGRVARLTRSIAEGQAELDVMSDDEKGDVSQIDRLMARAGCATARELEARYDRYRELRRKLDALERKFTQQEQHLRESEERIPKLFERVRSTLEQVDEPPRNEDDVEAAVGRAIAKYQVYRETKRRLADLRNQHQGLLGRKRFLEKELTALRESLPELERQLRAIMREQGFAAESDYRDVNNALAAYYRFLDTNEEAANRRAALTRTKQLLESRLPEEEALLEQHQHALAALLARAGFTVPEQARAAAENAMLLGDLEKEKRETEQRYESLLQGRALEAWRKLAGDAAVCDDEQDSEHHARALEAAEQRLAAAEQRYRALRQERLALLAPHRLPQEIEEDMAAQEKHIETLRRDVTAAAHAIALMEESLQAWRVQYGEAVAERASELIAALGANALMHLGLDPNAAPTLETVTDNGEADVPPAMLYIALRLAAAELLVSGDAPPPLIVDATLQGLTPPAATDKLLDALGECAQRRQVLLVFESGEIAAAAAARHVPVLTL